MEKVFVIKEKLNKIISFIDSIENENITDLEKDVLLQKLKDLYFEASLLKPKKIEKHEVETIVENVVEQEKLVEIELPNENIEKKPVLETEISIDFFEVDEEKPEPKEEKPEPKQEIIETKKEVEKPSVVEQANLFSSETPVSSPKIVAEHLGQNKTSINEILASQTNAQGVNARLKPVSDIRSAIGVGDRFLFIRELFDGNTDLFDETITNLNNLQSLEDAKNYLSSRFHWDGADSTVESFLNIVKRRYV